MNIPMPTGTITFLFSDIEGSTRLWEAHPELMSLAVARHDAILGDAVASQHGYLFKNTGDGIAAAFAVAADALTAALAAQRALEAEPWPAEVVIRSRMALHAGTAELRDGDYFGSPLNRCARLMAAGHGGQTLLSEVAHELCRDTLPREVSLRPLGEHRLLDLARPETIFQLSHPALQSEFPSLRTHDITPNNLPRQLTSFVGRERELTAVSAMLTRTCLLTLTGSGGTGKTRLAQQVAGDAGGDYPDGVWLVELASLSDAALVPQTVAAAVGVREQPGQTITQTLTGTLKSRQLLLLIDNCEHLLGACAHLVGAILRSCPQITILATSREALGVGGEQIFRVPSLTLPDPRRSAAALVSDLPQYESSRLFVDRATLVKADFSLSTGNARAVAELCCRLDGIPLAIELAAARVRSLAVEQINDKLDSRFRLLTGGDRAALPRQQTLRALVDWSYDLLVDTERTLLARLSAFTGGWTLTAAEAVCSFDSLAEWEVLDLLASLSDKSLVLAEEPAPGAGVERYRMLETVRQYSREKLVLSGEAASAQRRHRDWCVLLAEEARPGLVGHDQPAWLDRLETEHGNLRAALDFCAVEPDPELSGLRLVGALWRFWWIRGYLNEGRDHISRILSAYRALDDRTTGTARVKKAIADALRAAGILASSQGDEAAPRRYEESLALYREINDKSGIAGTVHSLGNVAARRGDYVTARACYEESLALLRELGDKSGIASTLMGLANLVSDQGDYAAGRAQYEECLALFREIGDNVGIARVLCNLGNVVCDQREYAAARIFLTESLRLFREIGDRGGIAYALDGMACALCGEGDTRRAVRLWAAGDSLRDALGTPRSPSEQAEVDTQTGDARSALGEADFAAAAAAGRSLTWEQAVSFALETPGTPMPDLDRSMSG